MSLPADCYRTDCFPLTAFAGALWAARPGSTILSVKRWDDDARGRGVASGEAARAEVDRLSAAMAAADWVAEDPDLHLLPHLRAAAGAGTPWRIETTTFEPDGRYVVELAWTAGPASRGQVREAVFRLVGAIAEHSTQVRERRADGWVEYEVVPGILDGDGPWRGHGHVVVFKVEGAG